ncbi:MAG: DUF92 domain-containing protein [bacterium]
MPLSHTATLMLERAAAGAVAASAIAFVSRRSGSLSTSGAVATIVVGAATAAAGWAWGALLVVYFVAAMLLTRQGRADKERLTAGVVAKGGARDALQVIANGGMFAMAVVLAPFAPEHIGAVMRTAALGALAASAADTWATEIGTLYGGTPRSMLTLRRLAPGTSGGMSAMGSLAMVAGAAFIAIVARSLGLSGSVAIVTIAGVAGALADSLVGATVQERRWCPNCHKTSEQRVHDCGTATILAGGREWMDNDLVNLISTIVGGAVAAVLGHPLAFHA